VDYVYEIGKFEVTAGQYTEFLNAVAATDTYGLYNPYMWDDPWQDYGCRIQQTSAQGSYSYSVASDWADRPVNYVSWGDAARFANWLHNGQPTGAQDLNTTEDGSYYLNGVMQSGLLLAVVREPDATWVIPSHDEWYKAAYHHNDGVTGNYYDYPTSSNSVPSNDLLDPDPGNNANFWDSSSTIGPPYYTTVIGDFENSESPYETFDQGGNVAEWTEGVYSPYRVQRGGAFSSHSSALRATDVGGSSPIDEGEHFGFRVARLPARGDFDANGTVDPADYAELPACLTGPEVEREAQCEIFDFDFDVDVDQADFAGFQRAFGTSMPEGMVYVPAGESEMGDPWSEGGDNERPVHTVSLSSYYMDRYEVTNRQYADALNWAYAQGGLITVINNAVYQYDSGAAYAYCDTTASSTYSRITWDGSIFGVVSGKEDHPMVRVSWYGAVAFCNWRSAMEDRPLCYDLSTWTCDFSVAGYRLPTEAEWEKGSGWDAAQERHFRFGEHTDGCGRNCLDGHRASFYSSGSPYSFGEDPPQTTPVGFYNGALHYRLDFGWPGSQTSYQTQDAESYYGCYDMSGNVSEWCNDWYDAGHYDSSTYSNPEGPAGGTERVLRGGGWYSVPSDCRSAYREGRLPGYRYYSYGFRCALGTPYE